MLQYLVGCRTREATQTGRPVHVRLIPAVDAPVITADSVVIDQAERCKGLGTRVFDLVGAGYLLVDIRQIVAVGAVRPDPG